MEGYHFRLLYCLSAKTVLRSLLFYLVKVTQEKKKEKKTVNLTKEMMYQDLNFESDQLIKVASKNK